jgi:hypothetical protein
MKLKSERKLNQACAVEAKQRYKESQKQRNDAAQGVMLSAAAARKLMKSKKNHKQLVTC